MKNSWLLSLILVPKLLLSQGPIDGFYKGKGNLDLAVSGGIQTADFYVGSGAPIAYKRTFGQGAVFAEYGITKTFDVVATLPFINQNLQDFGVYLKKRVFAFQQEKQQLSLAGGYSGPASNYITQNVFSIGQQAQQIVSRLVYQVALPLGLYVQAQGGFNYNFDPVPSSFSYSAKAMYSNENWYLDLWFANQTGTGDLYYPAFNGDFRQLNVNYSQFGGTLFHNFTSHFGAFVNYSQIYKGKGTFLTRSANLGFVYKFKFLSGA